LSLYRRTVDFEYHSQGLTFVWDTKKARLNVEKHGVGFEEAAEAFFDPFYKDGETSVEGERRSFILGYTLAPRMLLVIYLDRSNGTRIISARPATRAERKLYEQE
jgi:uncharacterized protein